MTSDRYLMFNGVCPSQLPFALFEVARPPAMAAHIAGRKNLEVGYLQQCHSSHRDKTALAGKKYFVLEKQLSFTYKSTLRVSLTMHRTSFGQKHSVGQFAFTCLDLSSQITLTFLVRFRAIALCILLFLVKSTQDSFEVDLQQCHDKTDWAKKKSLQKQNSCHLHRSLHCIEGKFDNDD